MGHHVDEFVVQLVLVSLPLPAVDFGLEAETLPVLDFGLLLLQLSPSC